MGNVTHLLTWRCSLQLDESCHTSTISPRKDQDVVTHRSAGCGTLSAIGCGLSYPNYLSTEGSRCGYTQVSGLRSALCNWMRLATPQLSLRGRIRMWLHKSADCGALSAIGWGLSHRNYLSVEGWLHAGQQVWDALRSWKESCYTLTIHLRKDQDMVASQS